MNFERIYLDNRPSIARTISVICGRKRLSATEAEEFGAEVHLRLILDDYGILRRFEGRSSLPTYLTAVITHLFQDWRNARLGRWRASAEAKRLGPIAVELERMMVRDQWTLDQAFEALRSRPGFVESRQDCEAMALRFPVRSAHHFVSESWLEDLASGSEADSGVRGTEAAATAERIRLALDSGVRQLPPQDRLILRMRFSDNFRIVEIARVLGLEAKPLYGRVQRILAELRAGLEAVGLTAGEAADVFAAGGLDISTEIRDASQEPAGDVRQFRGVSRSSATGGTT